MKRKFFIWSLILFCLPVFFACSGGGDDNGNGDIVVITPDAGMTLYGFVGDPQRNPIPGVVVSDGYNVVQTDGKGVYQMKRHAKAVHVFISVPSGYEIPVNGGTYGSYTAFYKTANAANGMQATLHRQDFELKKMAVDDTDFVLLALGDPQPDNLANVNMFRNETVEDIKKTVAGINKPAVAICLGDILGNNPTGNLYHNIKLAMGAMGIPVFTTVGNHDKTDAGKDYGEMYTKELGPLWYSFNRGKVHFVSLDNIVIDNLNAKTYHMDITTEQVDWLRKDLSFVPKGNMIVVYYHIPVRGSSASNVVAVLNMIKEYENALLICGHTHYFQPYHNTRIDKEEHILGAACGYFWRSKVAGDGVPNGYVVYEFSGTGISDARFKATNRDKDHQLRLYRGNADFGFTDMKFNYGEDYILANVFFAGITGPPWVLRVYEDDVFTGTMELIVDSSNPKNVVDQWIRSYHHGVNTYNPDGYSPCYHLFRYRLKNKDAAVRVEATDGFGNTYVQTGFTRPGDYGEAINYN